MVKKVSDFASTGQDTAGKTPSFQATLKGDSQKIRYQIKRSNYINRFRRWIGLDPDQSDIFGEYIASRVTASLLNKNAPPDLAPEVDLIYNEDQHDFSLASKYLNDRLHHPSFQCPLLLKDPVVLYLLWLLHNCSERKSDTSHG